MNQQKVDLRKLQVFEAFLERLAEFVGFEMRLAHLGAKKHVVALHARLPQALADFLFVSVEPSCVEMAIADLQGRLNRLHADVPLQRHGAEADLRNVRAMRFDELHEGISRAFLVVAGAQNACAATPCQPGVLALAAGAERAESRFRCAVDQLQERTGGTAWATFALLPIAYGLEWDLDLRGESGLRQPEARPYLPHESGRIGGLHRPLAAVRKDLYRARGR